ncbi:hypothetical protein CPB86DRAFT_765975 [Serendipita vermifera]|nr:hypothetical protein CPB86DRAFT_765975 [Serendipita vermifera]
MASQPTSSRNVPKASANPSSSQQKSTRRIESNEEDLIDETVVERETRGRPPLHGILHNSKPPKDKKEPSAESAPAAYLNATPPRRRSVSFEGDQGSEAPSRSHHSPGSIEDYVRRHLSTSPPRPPAGNDQETLVFPSSRPVQLSSSSRPSQAGPSRTRQANVLRGKPRNVDDNMLQVNSRQLQRDGEGHNVDTFLDKPDAKGRERFQSQETRRSARDRRYDPRIPHREREVGPLRERDAAVSRQRFYDTGLSHVQSPNRRSSRPHHHSRQRGSQEKPFRPQDPYAFPSDMGRSPIPPIVSGVKYAAKWIGILDREDSDSRSTSSKDSKNSKGKGKEHFKPEEEYALKERIQSGLGLYGRTKLARRSTRPMSTTQPAPATGEPSGSQQAGEVQSPLDEVAQELDKKDIKERLEFLDKLEREREQQEAKGAGHEDSHPMAPHGSLPRHVQGGSTTTFESAPAGALPTVTSPPGEGKTQPEKPNEPGKRRGIERNPTLSPPKASPAQHPASDPVSPTKRPSPFSLRGILPDLNAIKVRKPDLTPLIEVEKKVESGLRAYLRAVLIQTYRHFLLRMPSLYFNRVGRVIQEADLSRNEVDRLIKEGDIAGANSIPARVLDRRSLLRGYGGLGGLEEDEPLLGEPGSLSPSPNMKLRELESGLLNEGASSIGGVQDDARTLVESIRRMERFRMEWEAFVDGLVKEWKTLNVVSALLLSALLTFFQIEEAAFEPVTRTAALLSLVSSFLSLMFGGIYIIRFSTMRSIRKAARWVEESKKNRGAILWNVWVLLSMPVTWLAYSLLFFCVALMSFIWTSGAGNHVDPPTKDETHGVILAPRVVITFVFCIGLVYFGLVLNTFRVWSGVQVGPFDSYSEAGYGSGLSNEPTPLINYGKDGMPLPTIHHNGPEGTEQKDGLAALASVNRSRETRDQRMRDLERGLDPIDDVGGDDDDDRASNRSALGLVFAPPADRTKGLIPQITETPPLMGTSRLPSTSERKDLSPLGLETSPPLTARDPYMSFAGELSEPIKLPPSREESAYPFVQKDPLGIHDESIGPDPRFLGIPRNIIDPRTEKAEGNLGQLGIGQERDSLSTDSVKGKGKGRA